MQVYIAFASLVLISLGTADSALTQDAGVALDNPWSTVIELVRQIIKQGYPAAGIPVIDPYKLDYMQMKLPGEYYKLSANISNGTFAGLGDFQINKFCFSNDLILEFDLYFPSLNFSADYYEMEGDIIESLPLAGQGKLHIEVYDFNIGSKIYLKQSENKQSVLIDRFESPGFSVSRIVSKTEYDNNFDDILNAMTEDLLAGYLTRFNKYIAAELCDLYIDQLNSILSNISI